MQNMNRLSVLFLLAALNEQLRATIKTGSHCAYLPDPRLSLPWDLRSGKM